MLPYISCHEKEDRLFNAFSGLVETKQNGYNKFTVLICLLGMILTLLGSFCLAYAETEDLDQVVARKARYSLAKAGWSASLLSNPENNYIWQPETLNYSDVLTGSEIWMLTRAPDTQEFTSKEHGVNAWSFDGSRIGFFSLTRPTNDPSVIGDYHTRWLVNSDGSNLRVAQGYGRRAIPLDGFGWSHTENAYFSPGSGAGDATAESTGAKIYKNLVGVSNAITGSLVFDTTPINAYVKDIVKDGVAQDDKMLVLRDGTAHTTGAPNPINTTEMYFIDLAVNPIKAVHWGVARGIGPSGDPYADHIPAAEERWHDVWAPGPSPKWIMGDYSGTSSLFVTMDIVGTYADGGPKWTDWDGSSFGEIRVESNGAGTPNNPYGVPYFGHPAFDRWGRYALIGTYTDPQTSAGTRLWDSKNHTLVPNYMMKGAYDGQHHSMTAWSDYVAIVDPVSIDLYGNIITGNETTRYKVASLHFPGYTDNYNGYPRPSQSPDGTKIQYHMDWLNNSGDDYPNIAWAVAYYPYPPEIKSAVKSGANVRLTWDFNQGTISNPNYSTPRTYTKRGWPNETLNLPPSPREIKQFRVWVSSDNSTWSPTGTVIYNNRAGRWTETSWSYETVQAPNTTQYYAVTSLEHSGLESHTLSNTWKVVTDGAGNVTTQVQQSAYPADPGGKSDFYKTPPKAPIYASYTHKEAPAIASGQYTIHWNAPADKAMIRYYNIYAKDGAVPFTTDLPITDRQKYRIASIPASSDYAASGAFKYIDWLGATDGSTQYIVSSVDYQGNETIYVAGHSPLDTLKRVPK